LLSPEIDVLGHVVPQKKGSDKVASGAETGMTKGMEMLENRLAEGNRDERAENAGGKVTQQGDGLGERNGGDGKGGVGPKRRNREALLLFLGQVLVGKRKRKREKTGGKRGGKVYGSWSWGGARKGASNCLALCLFYGLENIGFLFLGGGKK
jgi:hypothetical protein